MKRTNILWITLFAFLILGCNDEKQIIEESSNNGEELVVSVVRIDSLYATFIENNSAIINVRLYSDYNIDDIDCSLEYSSDSLLINKKAINIKTHQTTNKITETCVQLEGLRPNTQYYYRVIIDHNDEVITSQKQSFKTIPLNCDYIDLGLSVLWATSNIGAAKPEEYGSYYAWGETDIKDNYNWANYKWKKENSSLLSKYCTIEYYGIVDSLVILEREDDISQCLYGNDWHLPSIEDWIELEDNCKWEWTNLNNTNGWLVTSLIEGYQDNYIFLPAAGIKKGEIDESVGVAAQYWSLSLNEDHPNVAQVLSIDSIEHKTGVYDRCYGVTVRPVCTSNDWFDDASIKLDCIEKTAFPGSSFTIKATINHKESIVYHSGVWSSDNPNVATVDDNGFVVAVSEGKANIYFTINSVVSSCTVNVVKSESDIEHEFVDLGLSANWASVNVGAIAPEGFGGLFAWGELETKDSYTVSNYKFADGYPDKKTQLSLTDDVAHVKWGGNWRIPSEMEFRELRNNCNWQLTTLNGIEGYIVTSKITGYTDRSIFLPVTAGSEKDWYSKGVYWTNAIYNTWEQTASISTLNHGWTYKPCHMGCSVRPVTSSESWLSTLSIEIQGDSALLIPQLTTSLRAIVWKGGDVISPGKDIKWSSSDTSIAIVDDYGSYVSVGAIAPGTVVITASIESITAQYLITVHAESELEHEYVDLGLSVKWATTNLGALDMFSYGSRYAWGETYVKRLNNMESYKWYGGSDEYTKYNYIDNKTILDLDDDVAHVTWGGEWRMPTIEEYYELIDNCSISKDGNNLIVQSNIEGYTDRSIILPLGETAQSYYSTTYIDHYWTSSLSNTDPSLTIYGMGSDTKYALGIQMMNISGNYIVPFQYERYKGYLVRPVVSSPEWLDNISISIIEKEINLRSDFYSDYQLTISLQNSPTNTDNMVRWSSSNTAVAIVNDKGVVTGVSQGTAIIKASIKDVESTCLVTVTDPQITKEAVDLGLSVKWATCNLGAESPEEFGYFYSWGETEPKYYYSSLNYLHGKGDYGSRNLTKYCQDSNEGYNGYVDEYSVLLPEDDAANKSWGDNWRIPTIEEIRELVDSCQWLSSEINGVKGFIVKGKGKEYENNSIFIPLTGCRSEYSRENKVNDSSFYWSSSLFDGINASGTAYCLTLYPYRSQYNGAQRQNGLPIRPVCPN